MNRGMGGVAGPIPRMPRRQEQHLHQQQIEAEGGRAQVGRQRRTEKLQELTRVPPDGPPRSRPNPERIDEGRECDYPYIDREHGELRRALGYRDPQRPAEKPAESEHRSPC